METRGNIAKGKVHHWQVTIKVGFVVNAAKLSPESSRIYNVIKIKPGTAIQMMVLPLFILLSAHGQEATVVLPPSVPDPIEPFNRTMWAFNKGLMTDVIKPTKPEFTGSWW